MRLLGREHELALLTARSEAARAGHGALVLLYGESGAGKSTIVDTFLAGLPGDERAVRVLMAACDPLSTPRPLGPVRDLAGRLGDDARNAIAEGDHSHRIFSAVCADLASTPTVLVIDDLHWADQGTVDLLRFVLRRIDGTSSLVVGALRDDELGLSHPMRGLLGDVARSSAATSIGVPPMSIAVIEELVADRDLDPQRLLRLTGGNAFFVTEMLDHAGGELPATVRDAVLARTAGLGVPAWDLLHLLAASPEAIPDQLLIRLGITLPALRELDAAGLVRRGLRGVEFRHDLCRLAIISVIPPGAEPALHARMIDALEATTDPDAAVLVHHAVGAGDVDRVARYAESAGLAAARSGAHTQAARFYRTVLEHGVRLAAPHRADVLERLAAELFLVDELDDAIAAVEAARRLREDIGDVVGAGTAHNALSVYEWYNGDRPASAHHVDRAIETLDTAPAGASDAAVTLGHAYAMRAYLALHAHELDEAVSVIDHANAIAMANDDHDLAARAEIVREIVSVASGDDGSRERLMTILARAPEHLDEIFSSGFSNLGYLDVEQRRLDDASALLASSIPLTVEHDLPICRVWQIGSRGRLAMMRGDWDDAVGDADIVLGGNSAPLAQTWPFLVRGLVALRRGGNPGDDLERAWALAVRCDEPIRILPAAAALAEHAWLSGRTDPRAGAWTSLLEHSPEVGLEWARGELAVWLRRLGIAVSVTGVAAPYQAILDGDPTAAVEAFDRVPLPYDAALAELDTGRPERARRAVDILDRLGADAVAAKVRRDLRASGVTVVPARRRSSTRSNPLGLTERQLEVLGALGDGSTNAELAARLYISEKTVDHHVSAILTKLGVTNRRDAARRARDLGLSD